MTTPQVTTSITALALLESDRSRERLKEVLPRGIDTNRFVSLAATALRQDHELATCDPGSFMTGLIYLAQLGLNIHKAAGEGHLITFRNNKTGKKESVPIIGYRGYVKLMCQIPDVRDVFAETVFEGDTFIWDSFDDSKTKHERCGNSNPVQITDAYAVVVFKDGYRKRLRMTRAEVDRIRDRGRRNPVWDSDYAAMAKKTTIRQIAKTMPLSSAVEDAIAIDEAADKEFSTRVSHNPIRITQIQADAGDDENARRAAENADIEAKIAAQEVDE